VPTSGDATAGPAFNLMFGWRRGGLELAAAHYHMALASQGYEVITLGHGQGWLRHQLPQGADFIPIAPVSDYDPRAHFALARALRQRQPRVLIAHGNRAMRYAARMVGVARIGVFHNFQFKPFHAGLDAGIAVSQAVRDAARAALPKLPFAIIPNLVVPAPHKERPARSGPLRLGALGRLHADKGLDILFEALADPSLRGHDWRLALAGEGEDEASLRQLARRLGIADRIEFRGWYDDPKRFFGEIDVLCMPSRTESFGLVLIEALAEAVPVITSDAPGPREIAADGHDALVVAVEDRNGLSRAIQRLLEDEGLALALGRQGQKTILARYGFDGVAARLAQTLPRLLPGLDEMKRLADKD
jgi:glycosyltransferase involved in cell wall biosynthesis